MFDVAYGGEEGELARTIVAAPLPNPFEYISDRSAGQPFDRARHLRLLSL